MTDPEMPLHPFSEGEVRLATINYEAQEWLTRELHAAFQMSGLTVDQLAELLEIEVDVARDWLSGNVDLAMSELRHLATALDAYVTYRVEPIVNRLPEWISTLSDVGWEPFANNWAPERLSA